MTREITLQIAALLNELKAAGDRIQSAVAHGQAPDPEDYVVLRGNVEAIVELAIKPVMFDLSSVRVSDERWESNGRTASKGPNDWRCMVCNRGVNEDGKGVVWVSMSNMGNLYPSGTTEDVMAATEGDMGGQPVGADCARKIPAQYK